MTVGKLVSIRIVLILWCAIPVHNYIFKIFWEILLVFRNSSYRGKSGFDLLLAWDMHVPFGFRSDYGLNINGYSGTMDTSEQVEVTAAKG